MRTFLDIGNTTLKLISYNGEGLYFELNNDREVARGIYIFLMQNSSNEWSYIEWGLKNGEGGSRISTSYSDKKEFVGGRLANSKELRSPSALKYWISIHNHPQPGQDNTKSDEDEAAHGKHMKLYRKAQMKVMTPSQVYDFYNYLPYIK